MASDFNLEFCEKITKLEHLVVPQRFDCGRAAQIFVALSPITSPRCIAPKPWIPMEDDISVRWSLEEFHVSFCYK